MKKLSLIVIALFIPALGLQAQEEPIQQEHADKESLSLFVQLDTDKDGLLSKEEAQRVENILAMFDVLDADADGLLTLSEFEALAKN